MSSPSISARGTTGMRASRAAATSGLSWATALETTTTSAPFTFSAAMAERDARAELRETLGDGVRLEVRALHLVAEVDEHFGDAAHAAAADADEVDGVDAAHAVAAPIGALMRRRRSVHAASFMRGAPISRGRTRRALRPHAALRAGARARPSPAACRGPRTALQLVGEALGGQLAVGNQHGGAFLHEVLRVVRLVIVDRGRKRHEHAPTPAAASSETVSAPARQITRSAHA